MKKTTIDIKQDFAERREQLNAQPQATLSRMHISSSIKAQRRQEENREKKMEADTEDFKSVEVTRNPKEAQSVVLKNGKKLSNLLKFSWLDKRKLAKKPEYSYVVTMLFPNGTSRTFVLFCNKKTFEFNKYTYYLYDEESWFDLTMNQYHLFYHESHPIPLNREVVQTGDEHYFSVTPENLKELIAGEYVKILVKANQITDALKTILLMCFVITGILVVVLLVLWSISKKVGK
jgi:hypothetical protein